MVAKRMAEGARRDQPLAGIRLRHRQRRSRERDAASIDAILAAERLKRDARSRARPTSCDGLLTEASLADGRVVEGLRERAEPRSTGSSSARTVGAMPAAASSASVSPPSDFRLARSILRRWPKAAAVTRSSVATGSRRPGRGARHEPTTLDVTLGGGTKARGRHVEQDRRARSAIAPAPTAGHRPSLPRLRDEALGHLLLEHQGQRLNHGGQWSRSSQRDQQRRRDVVGQVGDDLGAARRDSVASRRRARRPRSTSSRPG